MDRRTTVSLLSPKINKPRVGPLKSESMRGSVLSNKTLRTILHKTIKNGKCR